MQKANRKQLNIAVQTETPVNGLTAVFSPMETAGAVYLSGSIPFVREKKTARDVVTGLLVAHLLDAGTRLHGKAELRGLIADRAATISFRFDGMYLRFTAEAVPKDLPFVIGILAEQLRFATFPARECAHAREQLRSQIRAWADDARMQGRSGLTRALFAPGSVHYGYTPAQLARALASISATDIRRAYRDAAGLGELRIAVAGSVNTRSCTRALASAFSGWNTGRACIPALRHENQKGPANTYHSMPAKQTAEYFLGSAVPVTSHDDAYLPLMIGLNGLGGGAAALLFQILREQHSFTYAAYARPGYFGPRTSGYWYAFALFPPSVYTRARSVMREVIETYRERGPKKTEFETTQERLISRYIITLADAESRATALLALLEDERDADYVHRYPEKLAAVGRTAVRDALTTYLKPSYFAESVAGPITKDGKPLKQG